MNLWERFIAALVVAASFMPAVFLHAQGAGKPSDAAMGAVVDGSPKAAQLTPRARARVTPKIRYLPWLFVLSCRADPGRRKSDGGPKWRRSFCGIQLET